MKYVNININELSSMLTVESLIFNVMYTWFLWGLCSVLYSIACPLEMFLLVIVCLCFFYLRLRCTPLVSSTFLDRLMDSKLDARIVLIFLQIIHNLYQDFKDIKDGTFSM